MKKNRSTQTFLYNLAIGILLGLLLQGCFGYQNAYQKRSVTEVESDIKATKEEIRNLKAEQARLQGTWLRSREADRRLPRLEKQITQLESKIWSLERERESSVIAANPQVQVEAGGCFLPDTLVTMADGSMKAFERIRPGDQVLTYDVGYQRMVNNPVVDVYTVDGNHLYTINGEISTTGTERFLSDTGWRRVRDLQVGDRVHVDGRMVRIVTIDYQWSRHKLYNMQVDDSHSFYVATDSGARYLVHNCGGGGK